jgi:hypothetical protein
MKLVIFELATSLGVIAGSVRSSVATKGASSI